MRTTVACCGRALLTATIAAAAFGGPCWGAVTQTRQIVNRAQASFRSGDGQYRQVSSNTVSTVVSVIIDVSLEPGVAQGAGDRGEVVYHALTIANDGNSQDRFTLSCEPIVDLGWPAAIYAEDGAGGGIAGDAIHQSGEGDLTATTGPVAPGERVGLLLAVAVDAGAVADQRQVVLVRATSETSPDAYAEAEATTVASASLAHIEITPQPAPLAITETGAHYLPHTLINHSADPDAVALSAAAMHGWPVGFLRDDNGDGVRQAWEITDLAGAAAVAGHESLSLFAAVLVPADTPAWAEGQVTLTAISQMDGSHTETTDSIRLESRDQAPEETWAEARFPAGWHMIALPLEPVNRDPAAVIDQFDPAGRLHRYLPEALSLSCYDPEGWVAFGQLETGAGYWLEVPSEALIAYRATAHRGPFEIALRRGGWAMIGHPFPEPLPVASLCVRDESGDALSIAEAAAALWIELPLAYYSAEHMCYAYAGVGSSECEDPYLRPWLAYWIKSYRPGLTLVVPEPGT